MGLISGTSLDGIDAALVEIEPQGEGYAIRLREKATLPFGQDLGSRLRAAVAPNTPPPSEIVQLDADVGSAFANAASTVAGGATVDFVASHGVTLYHDGDRRLTWQIGNPFVIREQVGSTVLFDFRRADCAAGGHGAPLVPYFDALMLSRNDQFCAALNLGGIANVTMLPAGTKASDAVAWDVGPANMLLDAFVRRKTCGRQTYDRDGAFAAQGSVNHELLDGLLSDAYFTQRPPKSTGRERFGDAFSEGHRTAFDALSLEDGCATLTALTAQTVAAAILAQSASGHVFVSGGGVHNATLLRRLQEQLPGFDVGSSERAGIDPDFKEAMAFVVLGY